MCAAAHGWVGLGRIVYASSSDQLATWLAELGVPPPPVRPLPIHEVVPDVVVEGPVPDLAEQVREWQQRVLNDGSRHRVYKRYLTGTQLAAEINGRVLFDGSWFVAARRP